MHVLELLIDFTRKQGKEKLEELRARGKEIDDNFLLAMYFLDEVMDEHPEIDEIEVIWNVIRFSEKIKDEVGYLYDTLSEAKKQVYNYEMD